MLVDLLPEEPEPQCLAAMMQFHEARRAARVDGDGVPLTLEEQDRSQWDLRKVADGLARLERARAKGPLGPYGLKASISALHAAAPATGGHRLDRRRAPLRPAPRVGALRRGARSTGPWPWPWPAPLVTASS